MLERHAQALGFGPRLASVRAIAITGAQAAADPDSAIAALAAACRAAQDDDGAGTIILGGAGFAGLAARVAQSAGLPVIDSVAAGACAAERLARGSPCHYSRHAGSIPSPCSGIDAVLADKLFE